jgi:uncharacterized membrane protein
MAESYITAGSILASAALIMLISVPMIQGRVPRNPFYGFRTPKTLSSDDIWYPANAYSGKCLFLSGLTTTAGIVLILPFAWLISPCAVVWYCTLFMIVPLLVALYYSFQYLGRF